MEEIKVGELLGFKKKGSKQIFLNLCPHSVEILTVEGIFSIPQSGTVARVEKRYCEEKVHSGIPIESPKFGKVHGLPDAKENVMYIVSGIVLNALGDNRKRDVCAIGSRITQGNIKVATSFRIL